MIALSIETLLLMGAAYFLGAALACVIRRSLHAGDVLAERRVDPLPEVAVRDAAPAKFARVMEPARPPQPAAQPAQPPAAKPAVQPAPAETAAQDLERIRLIDAATEAGLGKLGITRYEQIAAWMQADVRRVEQALGDKGRINRENWIEQAQILAKGGETNYATRRARGEAASAAPTPDEGERGPPAPSSAAPLPRPMSRGGVAAAVVMAPSPQSAPATAPVVAPATQPLVSERAAFANGPVQPAGVPDAQPGEAPAVPVRPTAPSSRDNLQRISGITSEIEEALNAQGVFRYSQIAQWSPAEVERFDKQLQTTGRIAHENWIEQAQILSRGGDTKFSREFDRPGRGDGPAPRPIKLPDAIREHEAAKAAEPSPAPTRTDLGSLRSVRSKAYQNMPEPGPEAAQRAAARSKVPGGSVSNDLKRIRGIGVLIEKKLNSLGVSGYEQIANWTADDIERISQSLDFKGRIERENWVEQARILSAGGTTEFSRRVDRGEVESSRAKT